MYMYKEQIQQVLTSYYYMIDDYYNNNSRYQIPIEEIEIRCDYFENLLSYLANSEKNYIRVEIDKMYVGDGK